MRKIAKRMRVLALVLCCALLVNSTSFTAYAAEGGDDIAKVNVQLHGNDGQIEVITEEGEESIPCNEWIQECSVGSMVGDYLTLDSITYWTDRDFEGWMLCTKEEMTNDGGNV